jgi:dihydrolipoamide dehydrogenase
MIMGEKEGFIKIITEKSTGEILGTHIFGPRATDMISEICVAMKLESTIEEVANTIHPHPTVSEIIMEAAHDVEGISIHKPKK